MTSIITSSRSSASRRPSFTLIEMTIVMLIIAVLAALALSAMGAALQQSRGQRTRAIIAKIDQLIMEKYDSYRTRQVPIRINPYTTPIGEPYTDTLANTDLTNGFRDNSENFTDQNGNNAYDMGAAEYRLLALRELMRLEMPNLMADVVIDPLTVNPLLTGTTPIFARPSLSKQYYRRGQQAHQPGNPGVTGIANWSGNYEGAECLYLILASMRDGDKSALDFFAPSEIGDLDDDGMLEIHDSWGNPIEFIRCPLGYSEGPGPDLQWGFAGSDDDGDGIVDNASEAGWLGSDDQPAPVTPQTRNYKLAPDPFDPFRVDGRSRLANPFVIPVALKPLIYSAGPDKIYAIQKSDVSSIANPNALELLDPFRVTFTGAPPKLSAGSRYDSQGYDGFADNITNHDLEAR